MKRFYASLVYTSIAIAGGLALGGGASMAPANAAPPTVTPSPGYDARLQEQRTAPVVAEPVRERKPVSRHRTKRVQDGPH
jgi:hypothetical protein